MTTLTYYCTPDDVRRQMGITDSDVSDADVTEFIIMAESEVDALTHTTFLKVQDDGTATSGNTTTLTDSGATWVADEWNSDSNLIGGYMVWIYSGTNSGESRVITDNTETALTVSPAFSSAIDNTSKYRILKNTYTNETFTGDGTQIYFTKEYPLLVNPYSLTIDSTSVTIDNIYTTTQLGKLQLSSSAEVAKFKDTYPLLCNLKYFFGVYPLPILVRDLCSVIAGMMTAMNMIGGTYTFATNYSIPDLSVSKGVPYPHFDRALSAMKNKRDWLIVQINNKITRPMFG